MCKYVYNEHNDRRSLPTFHCECMELFIWVAEWQGDDGGCTDSPTCFYYVLSGTKEQLTGLPCPLASHQQGHAWTGVPVVGAGTISDKSSLATCIHT